LRVVRMATPIARPRELGVRVLLRGRALRERVRRPAVAARSSRL
jgi:hypothetical protein